MKQLERKRRRVNVKRILAEPDLRRKLMVDTLQATQAREGVDTTRDQAERAYYVVTEGERAAFFCLEPFRAFKGEPERRHEMFVLALRSEMHDIRTDITRRDFNFIEGGVLTYKNIASLGPLFRELPPLVPTYGVTRSGLNTTEIERFTRQRWEIETSVVNQNWVMFAKGGDFARFYSDWDLVINWTNAGEEFKQTVASKYGSASRFVKSEADYFRIGITWMQTTNLGINARLLPGTGVFGVASPAFFPKDTSYLNSLLALMNSTLFDALAHCVATRNWGATAIGTVPVPKLFGPTLTSLAEIAEYIFTAKSKWDEGNETCSRFTRPWLLDPDRTGGAATLPAALDALAAGEAAEEARIQSLYARLNDEVYRLYGIDDRTRAAIEDTLGERPPEVLWPQMEGKSTVQKRQEHVWRLLSYLVKRVTDRDEDGLMPFAPLGHEPSLLDRVRGELESLFWDRDPGQVETEIVNELKQSVKGYRRADSLGDWLANCYFDFHVSLYRNRPILWHIASSQGTAPMAFGALVHYHRFDGNRLAKLRAQHLRETADAYRREAAQADKDSRAADALEWRARLEEVENLDHRLAWVQEGRHEGPAGGDRDYRILTPWKSPAQQPKGWDPDLDDGVKVNIEPLQKAGVLRVARVV